MCPLCRNFLFPHAAFSFDCTRCHPCVSRLRGTGGDLIVLEEAAFIPQDVWLEVVIPLVEVKNTALVAISTPLDSSNFYSTLVGMKDDEGRPVFDVLQAQAACAVCVEQLEDPSKCPHVQLERPSWYTFWWCM